MAYSPEMNAPGIVYMLKFVQKSSKNGLAYLGILR